MIEEALSETGLTAKVGKVAHVMEIAGDDVFGTAAVIVDSELKSVE